MIELSNNYVALNLAKFIYEEEAKLTPNKHQQESDIKEYIFEWCVSTHENLLYISMKASFSLIKGLLQKIRWE